MKKPRFEVLAYRGTLNLGDAIQTYAMARLLPSPLGAKYRDSLDRDDAIPLVINGYLCDSVPTTQNCLFAGIYIGRRLDEHVQWIKNSKYRVGARDPFTANLLQKRGIDCQMIGCATLTLPRYEGPRKGVIRVDDIADNIGRGQYTQSIGHISWVQQWHEAMDRLATIRTAELVYTGRLHIALPCLAFGTPVQIPSRARSNVQQSERLSILDAIGFQYDKPNVIDVSEYSAAFKSFLKSKLGISLEEVSRPIMPNPWL